MTGNVPQEDPITILYVEDDPEAQEIVLSMLQVHYPNLRIHTADNGNSGLALAREYRPQIVITDICMPLMGGMEMAAAIKAQAPETMFIATTAYSETRYFLKAIEIGFNHFVLKPIDYEQLFAALDSAIGQVRLARQVKFQQQHIVKLSQVLEQSPAAVLIADAAGSIEYVNDSFSRMTGYSSQEVTEATGGLFASAAILPGVGDDVRQTVGSGCNWRGTLRNRKKNGEQYWEQVSVAPLFDNAGELVNYVVVKEDVSERQRAEDDIRQLNEALAAKARKLEIANQDLEAFNATVSHDLRSPIYAIGGFAQVLMKKECCLRDDECREYLGIISQQTERMERLIQTLLRFSRVSFQKIDRQRIDVSNLALSISLSLRMRQPERRVTFSIADGLSCYGDYDLLRIVLENLLGNAWKYTVRQDNALIEVNSLVEQGEKIFFVRDNGVGFDNDKAGLLFKTFTRLHHDKDFEGFGIGLATVQRIIEKHDGRIWAEGAPEQGACFYFRCE